MSDEQQGAVEFLPGATKAVLEVRGIGRAPRPYQGGEKRSLSAELADIDPVVARLEGELVRLRGLVDRVVGSRQTSSLSGQVDGAKALTPSAPLVAQVRGKRELLGKIAEVFAGLNGELEEAL